MSKAQLGGLMGTGTLGACFQPVVWVVISRNIGFSLQDHTLISGGKSLLQREWDNALLPSPQPQLTSVSYLVFYYLSNSILLLRLKSKKLSSLSLFLHIKAITKCGQFCFRVSLFLPSSLPSPGPILDCQCPPPGSAHLLCCSHLTSS